MWMISNFRDKYSGLRITVYLLVLSAILLMVSCERQSDSASYSGEILTAPESPRAPKKKVVIREPAADDALVSPVELESVVVRRLDREMEELAGAAFMKSATSPLVIKVRCRDLFDPRARTSWPVIELNGRVLKNSRLLLDSNDELVAFLPDHSSLKGENTVTVVWVGNEELTRTKEPFVFRVEDIGD